VDNSFLQYGDITEERKPRTAKFHECGVKNGVSLYGYEEKLIENCL
jgi:hypothetical protein